MRIFLDANILFSAALPKSRMRSFLEMISGKVDFLTNAYAVEEARRNLELKFPDSLKALERLTKQCEMISQLVADLEIELPHKDKPILGGAIAGRATHLLTGDERDFGKFWGKTVEGVKIISPKLLAEEML
ncbi:MAG TPA: PIN domain-containing protein [Verrucomicrobiae bacterium]|jgi:predicted nucleic acid-binding protein|nr:PIN domain-containing protein [Verrucomicrobiae bacterium]